MLGYGIHYVYTFGMTFHTWFFYFFFIVLPAGKYIWGRQWGSFGFATWFHSCASEKGLGLCYTGIQAKYVSSVMNNCILNESCRVVIRSR